MTAPMNYYLGCPLWGQSSWVGEFYSSSAKSADYLRQYASVFNAVEGNTTFYATPAPATVARWVAQTPAHFRFCFKLPQQITHDARLRGRRRELAEFVDLLRPLGSRVGPLLIQLPADFGPGDMSALEEFLLSLPGEFTFALELRHKAFFEVGARAPLEAMLRGAGVDNVMLDSRPMRSGDMRHRDVITAAHRKPDLPLCPSVTAQQPFARLIFHPSMDTNAQWLAQWAQRVAAWLMQGYTPFVFIHCPNNLHSPRIAMAFHQQLAQHVPLNALPDSPATLEGAQSQIDLF